MGFPDFAAGLCLPFSSGGFPGRGVLFPAFSVKSRYNEGLEQSMSSLVDGFFSQHVKLAYPVEFFRASCISLVSISG
jgi:hypothetical protein